MTAPLTAAVTVSGPITVEAGRCLRDQAGDGHVDWVESWRRAGPAHLAAVVWIPVSDHLAAVAAAERVPGARHAWLVEARPQWDGADATIGMVPGWKQITFLHRAAEVDRDAFAAHWQDTHAPLARRHHPTLWRYRQNVVRATLLPDTPEFDGIAELGMRLRLDFRERMYDSDAGRRMVGEDVRRFLDLRHSSQVMAREERTRLERVLQEG